MMTDTERALGEAIRARRKARDMTLAELGFAAGIDVSQLSKIERGVCRTSFQAYDRIAEALAWTPALMWQAVFKRQRARAA